MMWQLIETAPKVYRQEIIVYRPNAKREPKIGIDYWSDRYSAVPCWAKSGTPQAHCDEQPTHWMPLPNAPKCYGKERCNWPDCGCDPHVAKIIEALLEQGWAPPAPVIPSAVGGPTK